MTVVKIFGILVSLDAETFSKELSQLCSESQITSSSCDFAEVSLDVPHIKTSQPRDT